MAVECFCVGYEWFRLACLRGYQRGKGVVYSAQWFWQIPRMAEVADTIIERLRAVAAASNLRSPLARWLTANHDEFERLLQDFRPKWEALVEQFAADGLLKLSPEFATDEATKRKAVKAAMRTWDRVRANVAKKRQLAPKTRPTPPAQPTKDPTTNVSNRSRGFSYSPLPDPDTEKWGPAKK